MMSSPRSTLLADELLGPCVAKFVRSGRSEVGGNDFVLDAVRPRLNRVIIRDAFQAAFPAVPVAIGHHASQAKDARVAVAKLATCDGDAANRSAARFDLDQS